MMNIQKVSDVFDGNEKIHDKFVEFVRSLSSEETVRERDGQKWSITEIVEHVALVEDGTARICGKLLGKAEAGGKASDGTVEIRPAFFAKSEDIAAIKVDAPERVQPGGGKSIEESLAMMDETRRRFEEMRPAFEKYDCRDHTFPHPFFGDITAAEWLLLAGGHKARHLRQIKNLLDPQ